MRWSWKPNPSSLVFHPLLQVFKMAAKIEGKGTRVGKFCFKGSWRGTRQEHNVIEQLTSLEWPKL